MKILEPVKTFWIKSIPGVKFGHKNEFNLQPTTNQNSKKNGKKKLYKDSYSKLNSLRSLMTTSILIISWIDCSHKNKIYNTILYTRYNNSGFMSMRAVK